MTALTSTKNLVSGMKLQVLGMDSSYNDKLAIGSIYTIERIYRGDDFIYIKETNNCYHYKYFAKPIITKRRQNV